MNHNPDAARSLGFESAPLRNEVANCYCRRAHVAFGRGVFTGVALGLVLAALIIDMVGG